MVTNSLVIGYGNTLRGDDGAGIAVAETVASWKLPGLRSLAIPQLTPELALEIAEVETVIFVDATTEKLATIKTERLNPVPKSSLFVHHLEPQSLLWVTGVLYQAFPLAYSVLIPGIDFSLGEKMSSITQNSINQALEAIKNLCTKLV